MKKEGNDEANKPSQRILVTLQNGSKVLFRIFGEYPTATNKALLDFKRKTPVTPDKQPLIRNLIYSGLATKFPQPLQSALSDSNQRSLTLWRPPEFQSMEQSAPPITDNSKVNQATAHFLAKHNAFQKCIITSLKAENQALYAELSLLQAQRPLLGVEYDWKSAEVVVNNKVAKNLDRIMRDFDREVDKAEDRVEVEREVKKGLADIERERSWIQGFKDTIVQYKARDA